jgi:serine/threonine-protein kinase
VDAPTQSVPAFTDAVDPGPVAPPAPVLIDRAPATTAGGPPQLYDQALEPDGGEPRRGLAFAVALLVVLVIGGVAAFVWWQSQPVTHPMPELVGEQRDRLDALIGDFGWEVEIRETRVDGSDPGEIVEQDPAPGVEVEEGDAVTVVVSLGNPLVNVPPDLVGRPVGEVTAALEEAGLVVGTVEEVFDEEVPADQVMAVSDNAQDVAQLPKGTTIDLTVSAGPAPREVPPVAGLPRGEAVGEVRAVGLDATVELEPSLDVEEGLVIRSEPGPGEVLDRGTVILLVVSSGLPMVEVPDVAGMDVEDATAELEAAGLVVGGVDGPPTREVTATDPPAGTEIRQGSEVVLSTRPPPDDEDDDEDGPGGGPGGG